MNGNGHKPQAPDWIPAGTFLRLEGVAREFIRLRATGQVTLVLNFRKGQPMPSELVVHELAAADEGPADLIFTVRR